MTDRTLSAAELDAIATRTVFQQRNDWSVGGKWGDWVEVSPTERDALVDMARRTEAAERDLADCVAENAKVAALADDEHKRAEAAERKVAKVAELVARLDAGLGTTATYGIAFMAIRRALAEY